MPTDPTWTGPGSQPLSQPQPPYSLLPCDSLSVSVAQDALTLAKAALLKAQVVSAAEAFGPYARHSYDAEQSVADAVRALYRMTVRLESPAASSGGSQTSSG